MDPYSCDVLMVGGGLRAAIAVAETRPKLGVAVISNVYPMRSHRVSAEGGAAVVIKAEDSLDTHADDTISGGDWLGDQDAVETFVREAPQEMLRLEHWGAVPGTASRMAISQCSPSSRSIRRTSVGPGTAGAIASDELLITDAVGTLFGGFLVAPLSGESVNTQLRFRCSRSPRNNRGARRRHHEYVHQGPNHAQNRFFITTNLMRRWPPRFFSRTKKGSSDSLPRTVRPFCAGNASRHGSLTGGHNA